MGPWVVVHAVLAAQHLLQLMPGFHPLRARFPLPENYEALPTYTAMAFGIYCCLSAQCVHSFCLSRPAFPDQQINISYLLLWLRIPRRVDECAYVG